MMRTLMACVVAYFVGRIFGATIACKPEPEPEIQKIGYTDPIMTDYEESELAFAKRMMVR